MYYNLKSLKSRSLTFSASFVLFLAMAWVLPGCTTPPTGPAGPPYAVNMDSAAAHIISIDTARAWTAHYREVNREIRAKDSVFRDSMDLPRAEAFNKDLIGLLLNQKDSTGNYAAGIRIYYSLDRKGVARFVLVPYDSNYNDIINHLNAQGNQVPGVSSEKAVVESGTGGQGGEAGQQCPTLCSNGGGL